MQTKRQRLLWITVKKYATDPVMFAVQSYRRSKEVSTVGKRKPEWNREEVLARLMRIAEEAREATFCEKTGKNGEPVVEYDVRCASIELKAVEFAVKLSGLFEEDEAEHEVRVVMSEEADGYAV